MGCPAYLFDHPRSDKVSAPAGSITSSAGNPCLVVAMNRTSEYAAHYLERLRQWQTEDAFFGLIEADPVIVPVLIEAFGCQPHVLAGGALRIESLTFGGI